MEILKSMLDFELHSIAENGFKRSWVGDIDQLWPIIEKLYFIEGGGSMKFKKYWWNYPIFLCNEWAKVDGISRYYDENHDFKFIVSKRDLEKQFEYFNSLGYSDLKNMKEDFERSINYHVKYILRLLDNILVYNIEGEKKQLILELLHWCLGSFNGWVMYKISPEILSIEDDEGVKINCTKLNSAREEACKDNFKILLILEILGGKRSLDQLYYSDLRLAKVLNYDSKLLSDKGEKSRPGNPKWVKEKMPTGFYDRAEELVDKNYPNKWDQNGVADILIEEFFDGNKGKRSTVKRRIKDKGIW